MAAIARFSPADLEAYVSRLEKPLWAGDAPRFGEAPLLVIMPRSIMWRRLPAPASVGTSGLAWSHLSAQAVAGIRNGRMICIALQDRPADGGESSRREPTNRFTARDCRDVPRADERLTIVLGMLDLDTGTLHLQIN
ncbi:MAG: hypothetical protein ACRDBH_03570 [Bosea sp. (in: a-proteobacteria)]